MFNTTAQKVFDESIERALASPLSGMLASEAELNYAGGMVSYALFAGDISHDQAKLMHLRLRGIRQRIIALQGSQHRKVAT